MMEKYYRLLLALLFAVWSPNVCSQNADVTAAELIVKGCLFELKDHLEANKDSMSTPMKDYASAWVYSAFNDRWAACRTIRRLLGRRSDMLTPGIRVRLVQELAYVLHREGRDKQAVKVFRRYNKWAEAGAEPASVADSRRYEALYKACAARPLNVFKRRGDAVIPFRLDSVGSVGYTSVAVMIPARLNETQLTACFDTGSSANVLSLPLAQQLHLRLTDVPVKVDGEGRIVGRLAFADSLSMGNIVIKNVPFYVFDSPVIGVESTYNLAHLQFILGIPWIQSLGMVHVRMKDRVIISPEEQPLRREEPNLCYSLSGRVLKTRLLHADYAFEAVPDFGASHTVWGRAFMDSHHDYVLEYGHSRNVVYGGLGGMKEGVEYVLRGFDVQLGHLRHMFSTVPVFEQEADNLLGMDFFCHYREVVFDLKNMLFSVY